LTEFAFLGEVKTESFSFWGELSLYVSIC